MKCRYVGSKYMHFMATNIRHAGVVGELTVLRAAVSSTVELVLGCSPSETSRLEVMNELTTKFWELEELCSWLKGPGARICSWANWLEEAAG
jgi:hypothetical protein